MPVQAATVVIVDLHAEGAGPAGHGAADPSTGERILLGDDTRANAATFAARSVSVKEVEELGSNGGDNQVMMLLDTCYSGEGRAGQTLDSGGKRFAVPSYAVTAKASVSEWTAAEPNQLSGPFEPAQHGAFTYFAIGTMRGWADGELGEADG